MRLIDDVQQDDWSHLTAQAHGLYVRLCDRLETQQVALPVVQRAYRRYRRRAAQQYRHQAPHHIL
jgi:uncharacterized protein YdaU (DUF1376 family)